MGKISKTIWTVVLCLTCIFLISTCSSNSDNSLDRVNKAGYMGFGMSSGYPPFCFYNNRTELVGYDVDVANEIAKRLGVQPKLIDTEWKDIINNLNAGVYDGIVSSMSVTDERMVLVNFSIPYYYSKSVLVVSKDAPYKSHADMKGKIIGVEAGTMFESDAKRMGEVNIRTFNTSDQALLALHNKLIDGVITDEIVANYVAGTKKFNLEPLSEPLRRDKIAVALRKGDNALLKKVNEILKAMQEDGTLRNLSAKIIKNKYK
ncbi:MAG: transporter substrate-binding domain-containing protein [Proteobacteria bacterium]|nr:transporter substrate-binding domain-containing protein [Pseudomonadota bacterium]